ncbi:hypothetical protein LX99_03493 [Mucilaginibacter oryzae]|uniref:Uncharacterized protein n=1 Tax=Mucilaginibacter oryzae TaxID=468058 RepID=A0A316H810_9SPHI|nr:hypothetical protein [Mucilaginibacter oryzae]PWK76626.1 hypothetical protein LX99_03493 [Mucilaginibacter oryzae]
MKKNALKFDVTKATLSREEMKNLKGGLVYQPPGDPIGDGPQLYVCKTSSGDEWGLYASSRGEALNICGQMISVACKTPGEPVLRGPYAN